MSAVGWRQLLLRRRMPMTRFLYRAAFLFLLMCAAWLVFASRYRIGIDSQVVKCIPGYSVYLIDRTDRKPVRDAVYAFRSRGLAPVFPDDTQLVKILRAMPGDKVEITSDKYVLVNAKAVGHGLVNAPKLGRAESSFVGKGVIAADRFWMMGTAEESFDSRYWGTIGKEQLVGRAYPIF